MTRATRSMKNRLGKKVQKDIIRLYVPNVIVVNTDAKLQKIYMVRN